jgi:transposase
MHGKIVDLEQRLNKTKKDSGNSSVPPSKDEHRKRGKKKRRYFGREKSEKASGGQPGHEGRTREWDENPNEVVKLQAEVCKDCGQPLNEEGECVDKRQMIEIPPVETKTYEYHQMAVTCGNCGTINVGRFPNYCYGSISFGHHLHMKVSSFFHTNYGSYERTRQWLEDEYKLSISQGSIFNILNRIDKKLEPCEARIIERLLGSDYLGSDETQTMVNKQKRWNWIWQSAKDVLIKACLNRGYENHEKIFEGRYHGVLISDRLRAQLKLKCQKHQLCLCHLLRDAKYLIQEEGRRVSYEFKRWLYKVMGVWRSWYERGETPETGQKVVIINQLYQELIQMCEQMKDQTDKQCHETKNLFKDLWKYRNHLLTCLVYGVPFHNNDSERPLRHVKNQLKVNGGFRSDRGAEQYARFMSVYHTAKRRRLNPYDALYALTK